MKTKLINMKKMIILFFSILFMACGGGGNLPKRGEAALIKQECLSAVNEEAFDEMTSICNAKNEPALIRMIAEGRVYVLQTYMNATVVDVAFGKYKLKVDGVGVVWVGSEAVEKKY